MAPSERWHCVQFLDALLNDRITSTYVARAALWNMAYDGLPSVHGQGKRINSVVIFTLTRLSPFTSAEKDFCAVKQMHRCKINVHMWKLVSKHSRNLFKKMFVWCSVHMVSVVALKSWGRAPRILVPSIRILCQFSYFMASLSTILVGQKLQYGLDPKACYICRTGYQPFFTQALTSEA